MEHLRAGGAGPDFSIFRTDPEPLRALVGPDVPAQPDAADLAAIPLAVRRQAIEAPIKVQIVDEHAFDPLVAIPLGDALLEDSRATLVEDFVGLDVDAP